MTARFFAVILLAFLWAAAGSRPAAAAVEPRLGRYHILTASNLHLGYIELTAGGKYRYLANGGKLLGEGRYSFSAGAGKVTWEDGPLKEEKMDGVFTVEREGKTHRIQLKRTVSATNSTDSK
jgi:hypothetical protein